MKVEEIKNTLQKVKPHKAGFSIIKETLIWLLILNGVLYFLQLGSVVFEIFATLSIFAFAYVVFAFRNPERQVVVDNSLVFSPADGKIIAIEKVQENDYFNEPKIRISIYTAPFQVHVKRVPVSGTVTSARFERGNLAETVFITSTGNKFMTVQKVGYFRKFMFSFAKENEYFEQGEELGLLGSDFDLILPVNTELRVKVGDLVRANESILGRLG